MPQGRITGLVHTGLSTSDLKRSIHLFGDVLGFKVSDIVNYSGDALQRIVGVEGAEIRVAYADGYGYQIELLEYVKPDVRTISKLRPCDPGHSHLSFTVENLDDMLKRLKEVGFTAAEPPQTVDHGRRVTYVYGPDQLVLELSE